MDLPEPLVPADADLRGMPYMPLDTARLLDSDIFALSTGEEFKAAVALWCKAWAQLPAGSLPDDDRILAHLSGAAQRWAKVKTMALRGFVKCSDGRLYHPVIAEKVKAAWAMRQRQRERSIKAHAARWGAQRDADGHAHGDAHGHANGNAAGMPSISKRESKSKREDTLHDPRNETHIRARESGATGGREYAWQGHVIRLRQADFDRWKTSFSAIPDLSAELAAIDARLTEDGLRPGEKWFARVSGWLRSKHERLLAVGGGDAYPTDSAEHWRDRLRLWVNPERGGPTRDRWLLHEAAWGPPPGDPGCRAPPDVLREFNLLGMAAE